MWLAVIFASGFLAAAFLMVSFAVEVDATPKGRLRGLSVPRGWSHRPAAPAAGTGFAERILKPSLHAVGRAAEAIGLSRDARTIHQKLDMAGRPKAFGLTVGVREYVAIKLLCMGLAVAGFAFLLSENPVPGEAGLALTVIFTIALFLAPNLYLDRRIEARQREVLRSFSDVLDLLVVSAEAGLSLDAAMGRVSERRRGALSEEFEIALHEIRLGKSRADALRALAGRTGVLEIKSFASAIIQAENLGVSIAQVLRTQAETNRERRSQRVREQAARLATKMLFPMVFFIMPAIFIVMAAPGLILTLRALGR